jgi:hypothetical protein
MESVSPEQHRPGNGPVSGLLGLDIEGEGEDVIRDWEDEHGPLPETLEFASGKGRRLLYGWPLGQAADAIPNRQWTRGAGEVRILASGRQTVMPPSVHHNGTVYAWRSGHGPGEIEPAPLPTWLLSLIQDRLAKASAAPRPIEVSHRTPDAVMRGILYAQKAEPPADGNGEVAPDDPVAYVLSLNLYRRHLNESQRGMLAAEVANMPVGNPTGANQHGSGIGTIVPIPQEEDSKEAERRSIAQAAELLKVSIGTVKRAKKVRRDGTSELIQAVLEAKMPVARAAKLAGDSLRRKTRQARRFIR